MVSKDHEHGLCLFFRSTVAEPIYACVPLNAFHALRMGLYACLLHRLGYVREPLLRAHNAPHCTSNASMYCLGTNRLRLWPLLSEP